MDAENSAVPGDIAKVNEVTSGTLDGMPINGSTETAGANTAMRTDDGEKASRTTKAKPRRRAT